MADISRSATATITLFPPITVTVSPGAMNLYPSQTQHFTATVSNANGNNAVTWTKLSGPGAVNANGVYTSPGVVTSNQTVTVQATSVADPTKSATATITVTPWQSQMPYQYYVTDAMTSVNGNYWALNGSAAASAGGLTAGSNGGSAISRVALADGSSDYEVQATLHVPNPVAWGATFSVLARASADGTSAYSFSMANPVWDSVWCSATFTVSKVAGLSSTVLAQLPYTCHDGMKIRMVVHGSSILVGIDTGWAMTWTDTSLATGMGGVFVTPASGATISNVQIGAIDAIPPNAVSPGSVVTSASPSRVDLRWDAATDDNAGSGVAGYTVSRDGVALGTTATPFFTDETVLATTGSTTYSIVAFDWHGNTAAAAAKVVAVPNAPPDPRRIGVRATGAYWGAGGEQIDLMSGKLNFALPVGSPKSRGGWSTTFLLSYNSQMWRQDAGGTWGTGKDVGYV